MRTHQWSLLMIAIASALLLGACNPDTTTTADGADTAAAPPAETAPEATMPEPTESAPMDSGLSFAEMDTNGDGGIVQDELADTEMLHAHFSAADADGNGQLSEDEVDQHRADMAAEPGT